MKSPICSVCLNSDILCVACKKKLEEGNITENEIRIFRTVKEVARDFRPLEDVEIKKVIEGRNITLIVCGKGDGARIVGKGGLMIKRLSKMTGKALRVVEESGDIREFVQNLIKPVPVVGMNVVYGPEGEVLKVIIPKRRKIPMSKESFAEIMRLMYGKPSIVRNE